MKIVFSCDHAWYACRDEIISFLISLWHEVIDVWPKQYDTYDDYPDFAQKACELIQDKGADRWVSICWSGIGMSIAANRFKWVRAVPVYSQDIAKITRNDNDANVICFWARYTDIDTMKQCLKVFLSEPFLYGRFERRNTKLDSLS